MKNKSLLLPLPLTLFCLGKPITGVLSALVSLVYLYPSRYLYSRDFHFERCIRIKGNSCGVRTGDKSMLWDKGSGTS